MRQFDILAVIIQLLLTALLAFIFYQFDKRNFIFFSALSIFSLSLGLRYFIPRYQRLGVTFYNQGNFHEAIKYFDKSYAFFQRYQWLDKYRFIFILISSRMSLRESALINKTYCLRRLGQKEDAIMLYKKILEEFPESEMAKAPLKMLE